MWYFVTITRGGRLFYVISPNWGKYVLSPTKETNTYLWNTEQDAANDKRWHHLVEPGDVVEYKRNYRG